jgi:hypothetical protein
MCTHQDSASIAAAAAAGWAAFVHVCVPAADWVQALSAGKQQVGPSQLRQHAELGQRGRALARTYRNIA